MSKLPVPNGDKQIVPVDAPQLKQLRNIYAFTNPVAPDGEYVRRQPAEGGARRAAQQVFIERAA